MSLFNQQRCRALIGFDEVLGSKCSLIMLDFRKYPTIFENSAAFVCLCVRNASTYKLGQSKEDNVTSVYRGYFQLIETPVGTHLNFQPYLVSTF